MTTISVQAKLTSDELLNALAQLDTSEAEHILRRWQQLLAQRKVASVPQREAELLQFIAREKRIGSPNCKPNAEPSLSCLTNRTN